MMGLVAIRARSVHLRFRVRHCYSEEDESWLTSQTVVSEAI